MNLHISSSWMQRIACPKCFQSLNSPAHILRTTPLTELICMQCNTKFAITDEIINFGVIDEFYEEHGFVSAGRNFSTNLFDKFGLYFARHHYLYDISRIIEPGSSVIEIGCGGGSAYLASLYNMLGVEISSVSARQAAQTYQSVIQMTVAKLPLLEHSADALISSFILEHLEQNTVETALAEMARVLKPGGIMIHYFDLDTKGPFWGWAKRSAWYDAIFVKSRGHWGLRPLEEWRHLFDDAGFEILESRLFCKTWLQDLSIWSALDSPEVMGMPRYLGKTARSFSNVSGAIGEILVTAMSDLIDPWFPNDWAAKAIIQFRKRT